MLTAVNRFISCGLTLWSGHCSSSICVTIGTFLFTSVFAIKTDLKISKQMKISAPSNVISFQVPEVMKMVKR